jgi:hypothetical protein
MVSDDTSRHLLDLPIRPDRKKLKSSVSDVKVLIGHEQEEYHYPSSVLANYSKCIDAMLAAPMKEGETRIIRFPTIEPYDWDKMIQFVSVPSESKYMCIGDVEYLAPLYNQYSFEGGFGLCNNIVERYFEKMIEELNDIEERESNLHQSIEVILMADRVDLVDGREKGIEYFEKILND